MAADGSGVYLLSDGEVQAEPSIAINVGMADAWYNPATAGQGFFIVVWEETGLIFLSWFTYDTERPPEDVTAILGEPGHRWLTAQGTFSGNSATLDVNMTSGGVFDSNDPPADSTEKVGTLTITWTDCENAVLVYNLSSPMVSGEIPLQRVVPENAKVCEALLD